MGSDIHGVWQKKTVTGWEDVPSTFEQDRHYLIFAWLGNVRNGFGCAGVPTFTPITPLSDGRGLPEDFEINDEECHTILSLDIMGPSIQKYHEDGEPLEIWMGDHSFSWVSGAEVLAAEMPKIQREGIVSLEWYKTWDKVSAPEEWCGGRSGPNVLVSSPESICKQTTDVHITWAEDTTETLKYFTDEVRRLVDLHGEIRFVFGFDS